MTDIDLLVADLKPEEGFKLINGQPCTYDDHNDQPIVPGYTLIGHATGGYGFDYVSNPLTKPESDVILKMRATAIDAKLQADEPWIKDLDEPRQRALSDMAYNLGDHGLEEFTVFLGLVKIRNFESAADDLENTSWYKEVGSRAVRIAEVIRNG